MVMNLSIFHRATNVYRSRQIVIIMYYSSSKWKTMRQPLFNDSNNPIVYKNRLDLTYLNYLVDVNKSNNSCLTRHQNINAQLNVYNNSSDDFLCGINSDEYFVRSVLQEKDHIKLRNSSQDIDLKFCSMINKLSITELFECLALLMRMDPRGIIYTNFYSKSIEVLKTLLKRDKLNAQDILKLLFFAGLKKKKGSYDVKFIMEYLPPIHKLSLIEQSILADTLFKCAIKLKKIQGRVIEQIIEKNAELLVNEAYWLVSLCKAVRHIGPSKSFTMNNLSQALISSKKPFELPFCAHIVSLYAEAYVKNNEVLSKIFDEAFLSIKPDNSQIRVKDIDRLLWSARVLNYQFKSNEINQINTFIHQKFNNIPYENNLFVNILLSLWILGYKSEKIINQCFKMNFFESIINDKALWKPAARLQLLLTCVRLEAPNITIPPIFKSAREVSFKISRNIRKIFRQIDSFKDELNFRNLEINCPIKGIFVPGISAKHRDCR